MEDPCENFNNRPPIAAQETNQVPYKIFSFHNLLVTLKLDYWNFVVWKHQILNFLKSLELDNYILQEPLMMLPLNGEPNPKYKFWKK